MTAKTTAAVLILIPWTLLLTAAIGAVRRWKVRVRIVRYPDAALPQPSPRKEH